MNNGLSKEDMENLALVVVASAVDNMIGRMRAPPIMRTRSKPAFASPDRAAEEPAPRVPGLEVSTKKVWDFITLAELKNGCTTSAILRRATSLSTPTMASPALPLNHP